MSNNTNKKPAVKKNNYFHGSTQSLPEVINMDALSYASDDELERLHNHLQSEREKATKIDALLIPWEIEICYVQREMKIRNARRIAHDRYVRTNPEAFYYDNNVSNDEFDQLEN